MFGPVISGGCCEVVSTTLSGFFLSYTWALFQKYVFQGLYFQNKIWGSVSGVINHSLMYLLFVMLEINPWIFSLHTLSVITSNYEQEE